MSDKQTEEVDIQKKHECVNELEVSLLSSLVCGFDNSNRWTGVHINTKYLLKIRRLRPCIIVADISHGMVQDVAEAKIRLGPQF